MTDDTDIDTATASTWFILRRSPPQAFEEQEFYYYECENENGVRRILHEDTIKILLALGESFGTAKHDGKAPLGAPGSREPGALAEIVLKTVSDNNAEWNLGSLPTFEGRQSFNRIISLSILKTVLDSAGEVIPVFRGSIKG